MVLLLLTQHDSLILGPIAKLLGLLLNFIYNLGIHNIGLCIILFTVVVYMLMLPLTISQQRTARIQQIMNPEIQAIQKKYKDRRDQASQLKMQEEIRGVQQKYGVSTFGGCLNLLITFPILFAFYRVIYNIPAYVTSLKSIYLAKGGIVAAIVGATSSQKEKFIELASKAPARVSIEAIKDTTKSKNLIIDALWRFNDTTWDSLSKIIPSAQDQITTVTAEIKQYTTFLCYNIAESPLHMLQNAWADKAYLLCFAAIIFPIISALSQWLNIKLMPQPAAGDSTTSSLKTMNMIMPIFSLVMVFTLPVGLGLYWIAGALFRSAQQYGINRYLDKVGIETIIEKSREKAAKKDAKRRERKGLPSASEVLQKSSASTRSTDYDKMQKESKNISDIESPTTSDDNIRPGSIRDKANLVKRFNENNK